MDLPAGDDDDDEDEWCSRKVPTTDDPPELQLDSCADDTMGPWGCPMILVSDGMGREDLLKSLPAPWQERS